MKKIIITIAIVLLGAQALCAGDKPITVKQLPEKAQTFLAEHFAESAVSYAKHDTDLLDQSYDVVFTDGTKVEFLKDGRWKSVDCKRSAVPQAIIPAQIASFVESHHTGCFVKEIDRDRRDYEVKLSNGAELVFDLKGNFKYYD